MKKSTDAVFVTAIVLFSTPACAVAVPGPKAGAGLGAMALLGGAYLLLKNKIKRD